MRSRLSALIVLSLFVSAPVFAQSAAGVAAISGVVRDPSSAVIPGAKVVISSEGLGTLRTLQTNDAGLFTAPNLSPGPGYKVAVSSAGFAGYEARDIVLQVGQNLDLNVALKLSPGATQVDVTAAAPLVEDTKTDVSQVIDAQQITDLPINGRRVDSFVLLTPGVTNDGTFGLLTFRGVAGHNAFLIDGNDTTEQFYNENAGRTRIASQISQDAVQEFEVVSANYSAEYGKAMGGVVNTVTRSGSNQLHGTAYWFFRNQDFNARDRYATFNPNENRHQAGASVGGAITKDKLFYFLNVDFTRRDFPMADSYVRAGIIDTNSQTWVGCAAPASPAQCSAINALLPRFFGTISRTLSQDLYFGKIDYRPTEKHTFSASFNYEHFLSPNGIQTSISSTSGAGINGNGDDSVRVRNGRLDWTYVPKSDLVNDLRLGWSTDRQADTFNNSALGQGLGLLQVSVGGAFLGPANYLPRVEPNEKRWQFADNATLTKGSHSIRFGADFANSEDYVYFISNAFGSYTYQTVTNFALDYSDAASAGTNIGKHWQTYAQAFGNPVIDFTIRDLSFYLEDQWRATSKLTVNVGARYEYTQLPQPPVTNPDYPQTGHITTGNRNVAPRIGLAYGLNSKTVLRAGYGMFHARYIGSVLDNLFTTGNGIYQPSISLAATQAPQLAAGPAFPVALSAVPAGATIAATNLQFLDQHARTPYSEQGTVAIERELVRNVGLTVSYVWSRGVQLFGVRDANLPPLSSTNFTYTIADANNNPVGSYTTPLYLGTRPDKRYSGVYVDENGVNSSYNALAVQLRKRFSQTLQGEVSYTWAHEIDDGQSNGSGALFFSNANNWTYNGNYKADKGNGSLDQRHRLVYSFVWAPTVTHRTDVFSRYLLNNWQFAAIATMQSGRPVSPTVRVTDTPFTGMFANTTLSGSGLSFRVPFWPVNSLLTPPQYRADARLSKIIPFTERCKLTLTFDVFNVSNTIADTGISSQAYTEAKGILTLTPTAYGVGTSDGGFPDGTQARRMQIGARFTF